MINMIQTIEMRRVEGLRNKKSSHTHGMQERWLF